MLLAVEMSPLCVLLLLWCHCAASAGAALDWVEAYDLAAHREAFDRLGITAADLATIDGADAEALQRPMKQQARIAQAQCT